MASFLEEEKEIKKEEKRKLPTITIAIVAHGNDLINEKITIDPNVRIYSRAGQTLCFGMIHSNPLGFVEHLYYTNERMNGEDKRTTYEMLQEVAKHYTTPKHDEDFIKTITREAERFPKSVNHTVKIINTQKHNQIYTPFYDHLYNFTDNTGVFKGNNQITVIETKNHTSKSNIDYRNIINLAEKQYAIQNPFFSLRNDIEGKRFIKFFKKFYLITTMPESILNIHEKEILENLKKEYSNNPSELQSKINDFLTLAKLKRYSRNIYENRHNIFEDGFVTEEKLLKELENPDSKLYEYITITYKENKEIIEEDKERIQEIINQLMNEIKEMKSKNLKSKNFDFEFKENQLRSKFYNNDDDIIQGIKLSSIIDFLKSEGFVIINIIDFSCRTVNEEVSKDQIRILNDKQQMMADEIDRGLGRKRTHKRRQRRKRTQRKKRGKNK